MDPQLEFLGNLRKAAANLAHIGCNSDVSDCARRHGLPQTERVLNAVRALAAPGMLHKQFNFDEWLRFTELWNECRTLALADQVRTDDFQ